MYETKIKDLTLNLEDGRSFWFPETLSNGRASYIVFEWLVRELADLYKAKKSDHTDGEVLYEQKSYIDPISDTNNKNDLFACAPSSLQGPNNYGPTIKSLLDDGDYESAYEVCAERGYGLNDFYVFTNTGKFDVSVPFRFFIIPTDVLLQHLDKNDPRLVSRTTLLKLVTHTEPI
jgi:hypothetical protein